MRSGILVEQSYWDESYRGMEPTMAPEGDVLRAWLEKAVPRPIGERHALEIGCYPGRYLSVLAQMGYVAHGIDLTPNVGQLKHAFQRLGLQTGEFTHADFMEHRPLRHYDLVCSFGFIEHFADWRSMLLRHWAYVAPGGLLVIETPNFRGWVQQLIHRAVDGVNLARHNRDAMRPDEWAAILQEQGAQIMECGFIGEFDFWTDSPPPDRLQRLFLRAVNALVPLLRRIPPGHGALSPYCVLIARKPMQAP
ncbi:MAG: class I SAM-dependent methyltransferase [Flavobacteriales bacterium]|jgi:2-polyprenyl-3-methyl-5-hydroxy-6-metoxy-1,4-benzoquinol methylase|nr:class I SAM-dependent methyltransferase [Flavobacteriales bacterium]